MLNIAFPTAVGMNRKKSQNELAEESVPHSRGDEPVAELITR